MKETKNDRVGFGEKKGLNRSWFNLDRSSKFPVRVVQLVMATMLLLPVMLALTMPTASAVVGEEYAVQNPDGQILFIIGFVGLSLILVLQLGIGIDIVFSAFGALITVIIVMLLVIPLTLGAVVWMEEAEDDDVVIVPPPQLSWMIDLETDADVDGSAYPGGAFTAVDTAIGGTTGEWITATDDPFLDDTDHRVSASVHVDTDLNYNEALWMEPNAFFIEATLIKLLDGPKSSDGSIATQQYWGRIDSISHIRPTATDNATATLVDPLYIDSDWRHHIGWQDEGNNWLEACGEYRGKPIPAGASCGPVPLGTDDTTGDAIAAIASGGVRLFWIWEDRGPFSWGATNGDTWTMTFSIGSETDWHTYTFTATYTESSTNNA